MKNMNSDQVHSGSPQSEFSDVLSASRASMHLSLRELGERASVSPTHLCDMEHGWRKPSDKALLGLTLALKEPLGFLHALCGKITPDVRSYLKANPNAGVDLHLTAQKYLNLD